MSGTTMVVLATRNRGKFREISAILPGTIAIRTLDDLGINAPDETGVTFADNAAIKATEISRLVDAIVIADDSGIEVDALGGEPGVRSARYAGEPSDDDRNIDLLLSNLARFAPAERTARFVCEIAVAHRGQLKATARGVCDGQVGFERRGTHGFGYDPVFVLPDGRAMAELTPEEKNRLSHRAKAIRAVAGPLNALLNEFVPLENVNDDRPPTRVESAVN